MKNLYSVLEENPELVKELQISKSDIAAANYLFMMSSLVCSEVNRENDGAWVHTHSEYNEAVAKVIESHPKAVELILKLNQGYGIFTGGIDSQFAYFLVSDYLNNNFGNEIKKHNM